MKVLEAGEDPSLLLARHHSGDWGELDAHDRRENELSLEHGWRIVSSYSVGEGRVWIITEADRSYTTIFCPRSTNMKKTHDYTHHYRGYWSDGGKCRIRIYQEDEEIPVVVCSQIPGNGNTSVTNMAEYLVAEVVEERGLATPLLWIEHYPEHEGGIGEYSLVRFSSWKREEVCLGGVWHYRLSAATLSSIAAESFSDE